MRVGVVVLALIFSGGAAVAGPSSEPTLDDLFDMLEEQEYAQQQLNIRTETVTAGATKEDKALAAANLVTIQREEIERQGYRSLAEVLTLVPGLYIIDDLVLPSVAVRGVTGGLRAGSRIVKIMINGVPVNYRPDLTAFLGPEYLPMDLVERVEIAKGPLSAVYGANAFLATVNVITQAPRDGTHAELRTRGTLMTPRSYGVDASGVVNATLGDHVSVIAGASTDRTDRSGLRINRTFPAQDVDPRLTRFLNAASSGDLALPSSGYLRVSVHGQALGELTLQGGLQSLDANGEFQLQSVTTGKTRVALFNAWTSLLHEKSWTPALRTQASAGFSFGAPSRDSIVYLTGNNDYAFVPNSGYRAVNAALSASYSFGDRLTLKLGADGEYDDEAVLYYTQVFYNTVGAQGAGDRVDLIAADEPRRRVIYDVGAYLHATSRPFSSLPGFNLTGDVRVDKVGYGGANIPPQFSFRLALAYEWNQNLVTKIVAGRAFQSPSGNLLFAQSGLGNASNVIGHYTLARRGLAFSADLNPQTLHSVEIVTVGRIGRYANVEGAVYFQQIDDRIEFRSVGADFVGANSGVARMVGVELQSHFALGRVAPWLWFNYQTALPNGTQPQSTPTFPNVQGMLGIDVDIPEAYLTLRSQARGVGPRESSRSNTQLNNLAPYNLPGYVMWDASISTRGLRPLGPERETVISFAARNLLGMQVSEPGVGGFDLPIRGRSFFVQLKQRF